MTKGWLCAEDNRGLEEKRVPQRSQGAAVREVELVLDTGGYRQAWDGIWALHSLIWLRTSSGHACQGEAVSGKQVACFTAVPL